MRRKGSDGRRVRTGPRRAPGRVPRPAVAPIGRLRAQLGMTQEQVARLLGVAWATVSRRERGFARPDPKATAKLNRLQELIDMIGDALRAEDLPRFLVTPHPELREYSPADLLDNEFAFEAVKNLVLAAQSGTYR